MLVINSANAGYVSCCFLMSTGFSIANYQLTSAPHRASMCCLYIKGGHVLKPTELLKISADPESLNRLFLPELQALWSACCLNLPPSPHRCFLLRDLAFLAQSNGELGLPRETDALVKAAMKKASVNRSINKVEDLPVRAKLPISVATQGVPVGAQLVREWGGQTHRVTVLGGGWYSYQNQSYKSLTQVARVITGAHWSGPRFFGLYKFRKVAK